MIRSLAAALGAAPLLAACSVLGPDYARPAADLPAAYAEAPAAAAAALPAAWWKLYGERRLDRLVADALARNADLSIAVARIEETDANLREAGAAFLPEIDLSANPARSRISRRTASPVPASVPLVRNNVRLALSTAFELDFWGRLRRALEAGRALALGSRYAREVVTLSLAGLTTQAYFSLRSLDAQLALARGTLAKREEILELVRRRAQGGIASDLDLGQAELARADAALQLGELQRQRALVLHQLGALTAQPGLELEPDASASLPLPPQPPPGLPSALLQRRPDILQAEQQLIAANAQIGIAKAALFPSISLTSYLGAESRDLSGLLGAGAGIWSLGFGLTLPLFDAGRNEARAQAAEARQKQAVGSYQKAVQTAFREVADALSTARQTGAAEAEQAARMQAARKLLRLAELRYAAGYSAYLEVLEAQRAANDAELAFVRNRQARLAASVDLMKALGGGWAPLANAALQEPGGR